MSNTFTLEWKFYYPRLNKDYGPIAKALIMFGKTHFGTVDIVEKKIPFWKREYSDVKLYYTALVRFNNVRFSNVEEDVGTSFPTVQITTHRVVESALSAIYRQQRDNNKYNKDELNIISDYLIDVGAIKRDELHWLRGEPDVKTDGSELKKKVTKKK